MAEPSLKEMTETFVLTYDHEQVVADNERLRAQLYTAMTPLRQIAETPRNRGTRRNANATVRFLEAMTPNAGSNGPSGVAAKVRVD